MKVIPFGYSSPNARTTLDALMAEDERVILVDIRYSIESRRKPEWSGKALHSRYGSGRYLWLKSLGNENVFVTGAPIKVYRPQEGIARLITGLQKGYTLILLCTCPEYERCHRKAVVDLLRKQLPDVEVVQPGQKQGCFVKCLSIKQPFAHWLSMPDVFFNAGICPKTIENRDWTTSYRGPLLIHASKGFDADGFGYWLNYIPELRAVVPVDPEQYIRGAIIGSAELVNVVQDSDDPWFLGDYGFVLENAHPIEPFYCRGYLKLFDVEVCHCCSTPVDENNSEIMQDESKTYRLCIGCIK